ncbi:MAG: CRISPR-associated protein Csx27 [Saprospiraceae bacterium]
MDKFSIYELFSFIIPGYLSAKIIEYYLRFYGLRLPFPMEGNLNDNLLMLIVAIVLGVAIHVLTFEIINIPSLKRMKWWIYKPADEYIKSSKFGELPMIMPAVKECYEKDKNHHDSTSEIVISNDKKLDYYDWTFDFAYYYLEVNDKITQAKNFQSFYFLFRNLFVMSMVHFVILAILVLLSFAKPEYSILNWNTLYMVLLLVALTWLIVVVTTWLRSKMIDRVLWSYYVDRRTKEMDNK